MTGLNIFGLSLLVFVYTQSTLGFTLNSSSDPNLKGWASSDVQFLVNTTNCPAGLDVPGIITTAAKIWNNIPTSNVKVSYGGTTTSTTYGSPPTVYCETNFQTITGADQNGVPGAGAVRASGGQISSGLLILNASTGNANIGAYDSTVLSIILAHEIGHVLGLGHSENSYALMYYDASAKTALSLGQDDIDGMSYLYPRDELGRDKMMGCALVTSAGSPPSSGNNKHHNALWLYTLLAVLFAAPLLLNRLLRTA